MKRTAIKRKTCKCSEDCDKSPTDGCHGKNYSCLTDEEKKEIGTRRKVYLKKRNQINSIKRKLYKAQDEGKDMMLESWFNARRLEMTGTCWCGCNKPSSKYDDRYFKFSACHVLPKKNFKSIMYHPINFVELAFWGGDHTTFDSMGYDTCKNTKPILWRIVVERFKILYPFIPESEHQFIPQVLLDEL